MKKNTSLWGNLFAVASFGLIIYGFVLDWKIASIMFASSVLNELSKEYR